MFLIGVGQHLSPKIYRNEGPITLSKVYYEYTIHVSATNQISLEY